MEYQYGQYDVYTTNNDLTFGTSAPYHSVFEASGE